MPATKTKVVLNEKVLELHCLGHHVIAGYLPWFHQGGHCLNGFVFRLWNNAVYFNCNI